jgi:predicted enzyme related to lactoylglutathione lyase
MHPMTVCQVFYQATVRGIVEKSEAGYAKVQTDLVHMRKAGFWRRSPMTLGEVPGPLTELLRLPYGWLADNTRWQRKPTTYDSISEALRNSAAFYRKALWTNADCRVEIWLEKDALSGVLYPVTDDYDVGLYVSRGFASLSFLHAAAEQITALEVPIFIYHLGDRDPSGVMAGDQEAAFRFYSQLFGWEKTDAVSSPMGLYQMYGKGGRSFGGMMTRPKDFPAPPRWLYYVRVDELDAVLERVKKDGGKVMHGPMEVPGGDRVAQCMDPQGAAFALHGK